MSAPEQMVAFPPRLVDALAQYLEQRPYREVAGLINALAQQAVKVPPPAAAEGDPDAKI